MDGELSTCRRTLVYIREKPITAFFLYVKQFISVYSDAARSHPHCVWLQLIAGSWPLNCGISLSLSLSHIRFKLMVHGECDILKSYAAKNWYFKYFLSLLRSRELMHEYTGTALLCGVTEVWTAFIIPNIKQIASLEVCLYVWSSLFRTNGMSVVLSVCLASIMTYLPTHLELHIHDRHNFMAQNRWQGKGNVCHAR